MKPQEQEALSKRFFIRACVTPLSDGSFAVFALDLSSESLLVVENPDDLALAIVSRAAIVQRKTPSRDDPPRRRRGGRTVMDFDDVDFSEAGG